MTRPKKLLRFILAASSFMLTALPAGILLASDTWIYLESDSGVYKARMLDGYTLTTTAFPIEDNRALHSEEASILVDQRPFKNVMKSYAIKFDQTIGPALTENEISQLLNQEFQRYTDYYKDLDGVIRKQDMNGYDGYLGGEIQISYRDPTFGIQSIRARILYNGSTRLQQIVVGPDDLMVSYQTRDFFDSLKFYQGIAVTDKSFIDSWKLLESPTGMFTVMYPPDMDPPYYTQLPVAKWDDKNEMISMQFNDPVRNEKIFFNVYGYKFDSDMTFNGMQEVLTKRHITKFRNSINGIDFQKGMDNDRKTPFMTAAFPINPPKDFPYVRTVKLKSYFAGKYMVVEEVLTSHALFNSTLVDNLVRYMSFTPDKVHEPKQPEIYSNPVAAAPVKPMRKDAAVPTTQVPTVPKKTLEDYETQLKELPPDSPAKP